MAESALKANLVITSSGEEEDVANLKTRDGIVLRPQPSDDPADPLNWSWTRKHLAMFTISWLAFVCYVAVTALVPGTTHLATQFNVSKDTAVYLGNTPVALYAVGPLLWSPFSHFVGRRPVLLVCNVITIVGCIVTATAESYGSCMTGRVILGLGGSAFWSLGPASIGDIFFRHEKGKKIGTSTLAIVVAPFAGGIIGGGIIDNPKLDWRWSQWMSLILIAIGLVLQILLLPETIYVRQQSTTGDSAIVDNDNTAKAKPLRSSLWARYGITIPRRSDPSREHHSFFFIFTRPFVMLKYPPVLLSSLWFGIAYMLHVGITSQIPLIFEKPPFNFTVLDVGLSAFSGLIGALVGEAVAGPSIDAIAKRCLREGREWRPEMRMRVIWIGLVTAPLGLLMFGLTVQFPTSWAAPLVGQGVYIFGIEIATTVLQTYLLECYPRQGAEASLIFNLFRNGLTYTTPFFIARLIRQIGAGGAFGIFAALTVVFFPPTIGVLMWRGKHLRERMGEPGWSRD